MNDEIVGRLKEHLILKKIQAPFGPASAVAVMAEERALGFTIPPLLKSIFLQVGNGGFGPGYGIIGVRGGHLSSDGSLGESYAGMKRGAEYLGLKRQAGLLPFCDWGCTIRSCVDCLDSAHPVYMAEQCEAVAQGYTLDHLIEMWIGGHDIVRVGGIKRKPREMINPFTPKKETL